MASAEDEQADAEWEEREALARSRTTLPGLVLTVAGFINMFAGLVMVNDAAALIRKTPDQFMLVLDDRLGQNVKQPLKDRGWTKEQIQLFIGGGSLGLAILSLLMALAMIYGGYNLRTLNSYPMAMAGSIIAAIPLPFLGCLGIGQVIGIWGITVLLNRDVKAAFP
jgi:hypothetical protein